MRNAHFSTKVSPEDLEYARPSGKAPNVRLTVGSVHHSVIGFVKTLRQFGENGRRFSTVTGLYVYVYGGNINIEASKRLQHNCTPRSKIQFYVRDSDNRRQVFQDV